MKTLFTAITLLALVACNTTSTPQTTAVQVSSASPTTTGGFAGALNAFRASQGRGPLQESATLTRAAQAHAEDMARRGYFSHQSPGGPNGDTFVERARSAGCALRSGAENIANGQRSEAEALTSWENSPGHRRNMLVRDYTQYGLGRSGNIWVLKLAAGC